MALVLPGGGTCSPPIAQRLTGLQGSGGGACQRPAAGAFAPLVPLAVFPGLQRYFVRGLLAGGSGAEA